MIPKNIFSVETSAEANYLTVALNPPTAFDNIAIRMLEEDRPDFLMPVQIRNINNTQSLRYKLVNAVSLEYSVDKVMTKRSYVRLALDLLKPFIRCKDWFLDYHHICIDPRFILRDKRNGGFMFIYMPEASLCNEDGDIIAFFESVLNYIDIEDDREYQIRMMHYFRDNRVTLGELYNMFSAERNKVGGEPRADRVEGTAEAYREAEPEKQKKGFFAETIQKAEERTSELRESVEKKFAANETVSNQGQTGSNAMDILNDKEQKKGGFLSGVFGKKEPAQKADKGKTADLFSYQADTGASSVAAGDDFDDLFGSGNKKKKAEKAPKPEKQMKSGGLFGDLTGKKAVQETKPEEPPQVRGDRYAGLGMTPNKSFVSAPADSESDATMIDDGMDGGHRYLELIDSRFEGVPKRIDLNFGKPYITIGRYTADGQPLDVPFPENCKGISRQHARISENGGTLTVTDLGSTYFTLLDGRRLVPNTAYPLSDGMVLTFVENRPIRYAVRIG